ncbi:MAG: hypothetical protein Q6358_01830 [Candidatus Brocadiales bacterium]|nr:hypothetical protein [Candidatus Brocadiales bacterium]
MITLRLHRAARMLFHSNNHNVTTDELEQKGPDHTCHQIPNHEPIEQVRIVLVRDVLHTLRTRLVRQLGDRTVRIINHGETQTFGNLFTTKTRTYYY